MIIALFGGAISLSRRVPEIQKKSEPNYVGTEAEPAMDMRQAREELVFQIMQFVSAPLIAITAHQVIEPETQASAVGLAFLAGFGSETVLLMIRGVANGVQPRSVTRRATGSLTGIVRNGARPVAGAEVSVADGARCANTNAEGHYLISAIPVGTQQVRCKQGEHSATCPVQILADRSVTCDLALQAGGAAAPEEQSAALRVAGPAADELAADTVHIRLCVDDDGVETGTLVLNVDGKPATLCGAGCTELELEPGRAYELDAHGRRDGRDVHGKLALTASPADEGKPYELALA